MIKILKWLKDLRLGWMNDDDDADLGSGSGFHKQCKSKQPLLKGVKNPILMMGVHNPF